MSIPALAEYMEEEALDLINYGCMMTIRARRLKAAAEIAERGGT